MGQIYFEPAVRINRMYLTSCRMCKQSFANYAQHPERSSMRWPLVSRFHISVMKENSRFSRPSGSHFRRKEDSLSVTPQGAAKEKKCGKNNLISPLCISREYAYLCRQTGRLYGNFFSDPRLSD